MYQTQITNKNNSDITYGDIRNNCDDPKRAKVFPKLWEDIKHRTFRAAQDCFCHCPDCEDCWAFLGVFICGYIIFPVLVLSKIFQAVFPYFIIGYIYSHNDGNHDIWTKIDIFQLVMLFTYIGLQFILLVLGIMAFRVTYFLWHLNAGHNYINPNQTIGVNANKWYDRIQWYPKAEELVTNKFGTDIAQIILEYVTQIQLS